MGNPIESVITQVLVIRESSTPRQKTARASPERLHALKAMPYADYLQTPEWRQRRNLALQLARWSCAQCQAQSNLHVHHRCHDRLGEELDIDLAVLCATCHEGHRYAESRTQHLGIYLKLVSEALREQPYVCFADLADDVKRKCARARVPYDSGRIGRAIELMDGNRRGVLVSAPRPLGDQTVETAAPIGRAEATAIYGALGFPGAIRRMPMLPGALHPDQLEAQRREILTGVTTTPLSPPKEDALMPHWERARLDRQCGRCGCVVRQGHPLLAFHGPKWTKERCPSCAETLGYAVPADLPPLPKPLPMTPSPSTRRPFRSAGELVQDWKQKASGE